MTIDLSPEWLLEYEDDGDVYTDAPTAERLAIALAFSPSRTYAALLHKPTETCWWCFGERARRIVEVRLVGDGRTGHFVVASSQGDQGPTEIGYGSQGADDAQRLEVRVNEVLSEERVRRLFDSVLAGRPDLADLVLVPKKYLFG